MVERYDALKYIEDIFPKELTESAFCKEIFGGHVDYEKLNFLEKTVIASVISITETQSSLNEENIDVMARKIQLITNENNNHKSVQ